MGNFCSRYIHIFDLMMARRNAVPSRCLPSSTRASSALQEPRRSGVLGSAAHHHEAVFVCDSSCLEHATIEAIEEQDVANNSISPAPTPKKPWFPAIFRKEIESRLKRELGEKTKVIHDLESAQRHRDERIRKLTDERDRVLRDFQDLTEASASETQRFKSALESKEQALKDANSHTSKLETKCKKLEAQVALLEQQAAQESLASGSYSDDRANPGMLEGACKAVDKATEDLARVLHDSITKIFPLNSPELEHLVRQMSPAQPAEFARPIQVRYVWAHWICVHMFQGFEHTFFDVGGGQLNSPLDPKKHASECFRRFQQQKQSPSSLESLDLFQAFCKWKYRVVFPSILVNQVFQPKRVVCKESGRFSGDEKIFERFKDVARAAWQLHELAFSFDPPASILRMARGTLFDKQFHKSLVPVEDQHSLSSQMVSFMIRPGFRVRKSIIQSRVFVCDDPNRRTDHA